MPALGGGLCCLTLGFYFRSGVQDQSTLEQRDDVLVYNQRTAGRKTWRSSDRSGSGCGPRPTARDTDFTAKLVDVHPDGFAQHVLNRVVRARYRNGSKAPPAPVEPGRAYEYEIDLGYTANIFRGRPPRQAGRVFLCVPAPCAHPQYGR